MSPRSVPLSMLEVHVSQLADKFVKDPNEVVKVGQKVDVLVLQVELERKRISLTMRKQS